MFEIGDINWKNKCVLYDKTFFYEHLKLNNI